MNGTRIPTLLTFGPMIDSELCRFLLWRYGVAYFEERHIFGWASLLSLLRARTPRIPVLCGAGLRLVGPRGIVDHFENVCTIERKLLPPNQPLRSAIEADWLRFNGDLATEVAAAAYFYLLPHPEILIGSFSTGLPEIEAAWVNPAYPILRQAFTLLLRLSAQRTAAARLRVFAIFDLVDARLEDDRRFLYGDDLTLSDLSFSTAAAPFLLPQGYTSPLPPLEGMPEEMKALIQETRKRPLCALVQRIYDLRSSAEMQEGRSVGA